MEKKKNSLMFYYMYSFVVGSVAVVVGYLQYFNLSFSSARVSCVIQLWD